ncbi:hypothetical protein B0T24DRAFT_724109 [Lasiosphaeria ovina]|uniref:Uncharacterized protein n=1 Tax=Lasiosphaeria ovina TaxID=92902 RepID=A0AAE0N041_9PEZI|nr:hypothetical protein B0T24DRAFT_724109 [Lasiosphaeria ovina]
MLLTSAQVSFAVSTSVIVLCTAALFLSGYVIQQRTLRDLRAAIRPTPRPSPKIFLPDRFKQSTTELEDGTVIAVDDPYDNTRPAAAVEVKPTPPQQPDSAAPELRQRPIDANTDTGETDASQQKLPTKTAPEEHDAHTHAQKTKTKKKKTKPARSRWWLYKQKKDAAAAADENRDADDEDSQKPISRAERRRRIRADIQKLSQGSQRGYYQRRLY